MTYNSNTYLNKKQMKVNAQYIMNWLVNRGWSANAVAGMLGNMETESTINPGLWQSMAEGRLDLGFGLVQWTPASKLINWAKSKKLNYKTFSAQLQRIEWEVENNQQWISSEMTFREFKSSNKPASELGMLFLRAYERPKNPNQPIRGTQAEYWYNELDHSGAPSGLQLAQFPMDVINVTQGENGPYSHRGTLCMDFVGTTARYPYYAPCDCEVIARDNANAFLVFRSMGKVMCGDGVEREIVWDCMHDNTLLFNVGDKLLKGELMGRTGTGGVTTGDHLHLNVIEGQTYQGFDYKPDPALRGTELHIYDVFSVGGVKIINGGGYTWEINDFEDGGGEKPVPPPEEDKIEDYIQLLLCDAVNGWKW